jgi:hypothetical protein
MHISNLRAYHCRDLDFGNAFIHMSDMSNRMLSKGSYDSFHVINTSVCTFRQHQYQQGLEGLEALLLNK